MTHHQFTEKELPALSLHPRDVDGITWTMAEARAIRLEQVKAIDAYRKRLMEQEPIMSINVGINTPWGKANTQSWPDVSGLAPGVYQLYAAPMPQAEQPKQAPQPVQDELIRAIYDYADYRVLAVQGHATEDEVKERWAELNAALAQAQASGQAAPSDDAMERALTELVDKIVPSLDTGDLVADATTASRALDRVQPAASAPSPTISRSLLGRIVDEVFDSCCEDTSAIEEIYRLIAGEYGAPVAAQAAQPDAYLMARGLAISLHAKHYATEAPEWKPLGDLAGVLTQIDNMTTGLVCAQAPAAVPLDDSSLLSDIEDWLSDLRQANHTGYVPQNVFTEAGYFVERIEVLRAAAPTPPASAAPAIDRNAIIEECAKVAEGARDGSRSHLFRSAGTIIAGNIRALKDAPQDGAMAAGREG